MENNFNAQLIELLYGSEWFMDILRAVRICDPPDWLVGGGVIRNIVWDHLHGYVESTPLKDVDVAFFDDAELSPERDRGVQNELHRILPNVPWEAKNQAAVHLWYERVFGFPVEPLVSSADAIATWPEPATCVAVRLLDNDEIVTVAPYGLDDLFYMVLRRNPQRITNEIFLDRLRAKTPQAKWPKVHVIL